MKIKAFLLLMVFAGSLMAQSSALYYRPFSSGQARYKLEAIRLTATPAMEQRAVSYSYDPRVQELIIMAQALDSFIFDGLRLVRQRGVLQTPGPIDQAAIDRATVFFNITPTEARAWLLASRAMQLSGYEEEGIALILAERDMIATAQDLLQRLQTYFSAETAIAFMPRLGWIDGQPVPALDLPPSPVIQPPKTKSYPLMHIRYPLQPARR
jgi:hypothetical protein